MKTADRPTHVHLDCVYIYVMCIMTLRLPLMMSWRQH